MTTEIQTCQHYWVIETANGPYSKGQCSKCHEVRDNFENSSNASKEAPNGYGVPTSRLEEKPCEQCDGLFIPYRINSRYCGKRCAGLASRDKRNVSQAI